MRYAVTALLLLLASAEGALAQQALPLSDTQMLGRRLFVQSCLVCHTRPHITAGLYGPPLSRESVGGQAEVMRAFIAEGSPRMPAFKHHFEPAEIEAIVQYLKTVPKPSPRGGGSGSGDVD